MSATPKIAITGATGFIGRQLLSDCRTAGLPVWALTRQDQPLESGINWVKGDLFDAQALTDLVRDADCVIHLAGATKALRASDFQKINSDATADLLEICKQNGVRRFIFLSSLAATRPDVSAYAASKASAEEVVDQYVDDLEITVIRAPAVLGPDDDATYPLFSNLAKGTLPVPGGVAGQAKFSIIDVADLSALLLSLAKVASPIEPMISPYGHQSLGWQDVADCAERIQSRYIRQLTIPLPVLGFVAGLLDVVTKITGKPQVFSRDKVREMKAGDWIAQSPVPQPIPLEETLNRCLSPFQEIIAENGVTHLSN